MSELSQIKVINENKTTALHTATKAGNLELVKKLIMQGVDVNAVDENGNSPLQIAIENDYTKIIDILLEKSNTQTITAAEEFIKAHIHDIIDLSSGNPKVFPEITAMLHNFLKEISVDSQAATRLSQYGSVFGDAQLVNALIQLFKSYQLNLTPDNFLISNGSQIALFYALTSFTGHHAKQKLNLLLPQSPEYADYKAIGLPPEQFKSLPSKIEIIDKHLFRYRVNLDLLDFTDIGAVLLSRPCNPSGSFLPKQELQILISKAKESDAVVIVDGAYSIPFPDLVYHEEKEILFEDNLIQTFSFSKAGLAGARLGIMIGEKELIKPVRIFQINTSLTVGILPQLIAGKALETGKLQEILQTTIRPYYYHRLEIVKKLFHEYMNDHIPYYLHQPDGGIFQWVWFKDLPIKDQELYEKLREDNLFITPGNIFFFGLPDENWKHRYECMRISLIDSEEHLRQGIKRLAVVINDLYKRYV